MAITKCSICHNTYISQRLYDPDAINVCPNCAIKYPHITTKEALKLFEEQDKEPKPCPSLCC